MKMNRIQFQPGLSMPEFFERYATEVQCQAALQAARSPVGLCLPEVRWCGAKHVSSVAACRTGSAARARTRPA